MNILIPMAGSNKLFKENGYNYPKNLIEIVDKPLIQHVYENLNVISDNNFIFIIQKQEQESYHTDDVVKLISDSFEIIGVEGSTQGAACSALLAIDSINSDEPLLITNGDQIVFEDLSKIISDFNKRKLDGGIVVFESIHPRWSFALVNKEGFVTEVAEKRPISKFATAGMYYFAKGKDFVTACMEMIKKDVNVDGKYYISPVYNEMILRQKKIGIYKIDREQYVSLASPQDISNFEKYIKTKKAMMK